MEKVKTEELEYMSVYDRVVEFKKKYPTTVAWRLKKNAKVVEDFLNPDEKVLYAFVAQKNNNPFDIISTAVIAITTERIIVGRKRVVFGYFLNSVTPDMFNDLKITKGVFWGKVYIDTVKEFVCLSNISRKALSEIETNIFSNMKRDNKDSFRVKE